MTALATVQRPGDHLAQLTTAYLDGRRSPNTADTYRRDITHRPKETEMMDLEPLREAARRMRERAAAATPGPWTVTDNLCIEAPSGFRGRVVPSVGAYEGGWPSAADAQHIASWQPAVALAVADWLDTGANPYACVDREPMFRVARAYLGTASPASR